MSDDDTATRFERRSLIKKGLLAGGVVATMPVISTLDATAFAASQPDYHRVQFTIDAAGTITEVTPDSANCVPSVPPDTGQWATAQTGLATVATSGPDGFGIYTFTLTGSFATCQIVDATARRLAVCHDSSVFGGIETNTANWDRDDLNPGPVSPVTIRLLIRC